VAKGRGEINEMSHGSTELHCSVRRTDGRTDIESHITLPIDEANVIGNESVLIQLAQCRFPGLAMSNAKI